MSSSPATHGLGGLYRRREALREVLANRYSVETHDGYITRDPLAERGYGTNDRDRQHVG